MDTKATSRSRAARAARLMRHPARALLEALMVGTMLTLLSVSGRAMAAEPWPQMLHPPRASMQWIAQSMRVNGVPTQVMQFQSPVSRSEMVDYYRAQWSRGYEHEPAIHTLGNATILGQKRGPYLMTVKIEDTERGGSWGLVSIAQVVGSKLDSSPGELPLMPGAHVVSVVESDDAGKRSRQVVILAPQSLASVTQFYQASLVNAGWLQVQGKEGTDSAAGSAGAFVAFARGSSEMQLSIVPTPNRRDITVLSNLVTKGTGPGGR